MLTIAYLDSRVEPQGRVEADGGRLNRLRYRTAGTGSHDSEDVR